MLSITAAPMSEVAANQGPSWSRLVPPVQVPVERLVFVVGVIGVDGLPSVQVMVVEAIAQSLEGGELAGAVQRRVPALTGT